MAVKILKAETVSALSETAVALKEAFDNGAKIIPISYEADANNPQDVAWANRVAQWSKAKAEAENLFNMADNDEDRAMYESQAVTATKNLRRAKLGQFGYAIMDGGKIKRIDGSFADTVVKAIAELNGLDVIKNSPNAVYIVRKGEDVENGKITITLAEARKRPRGVKVSADSVATELDGAYEAFNDAAN